MTIPNLFYSFRARLLFLLAALLIATLGVQYYLDREAEQRFAQVLAEQEQALSAGFALAVKSLSSTFYLAGSARPPARHSFRGWRGRRRT